MNELLHDTLGLQRYAEDLARAEESYARHAALGTDAWSARDRVALGLIAVATKLHPALTIHVQRQPATLVEASTARHFTPYVPSNAGLCIGKG